MSISPLMRHHRIWASVNLTLATLLLCFPQFLSAQLLQKAWDRDYGGTGWEECNAASATNDGGYIVGGYTTSNPSGNIMENTNDLFPSPDTGDGWIVKTDNDGMLEWEKRYGGDRQDRFWSIDQTPDGGYILGGWSRSNIGPMKSEACYGEHDYWIVKTNSVGDYMWDRTFGGDSLDYLQNMILTDDGGFLIGGMSRSNAGAVKSEARRGDFDIWLVKVNGSGGFEWEKTLGGTGEERLNEMHQAPDGHYLIGGSTESPVDGADVNRPQIGGKDFWFLKVDGANGNIIWEERFGGTDEDEIQSFVPASDGGYLLVGGSRSPANPTGGKTQASLAVDIWALKINAARQYEWDVTLGGNEFDNCYSAKENTVGHFILGGYSQSGTTGSKSSPNKGAVGTEDFWLNYISPSGVPLWDEAFGGDQSEVMENMFQTNDGGYMLVGHSRSGITGNKSVDTWGLNDFWIVKTECNINIDFNDTIVCPNTDVVLNANDENCLLCEWRWDDNTTDSLRNINIANSTNFAVTLTDGVGCSRSADLQVDVFNVDPLDLPTTAEICADETEIIGVPAVATSTYSWSNAIFTSEQEVDVEDTYALTITDANGCMTMDSVELVVNPLPTVDIGPDTTLCAGSPITFDAENPGYNYTWIPTGNQQTLTITPTTPMPVGVLVTNPTTNCAASAQLNITDIYELPALSNLVVDCNPDNISYHLSFSVADSSQVNIIGLDGVWQDATTYLVDSLPSGSNYDFYLENPEGCTSENFADIHTCICSSSAGNFMDNEISICGEEQYNIVMNNVNVDGNDHLAFIVHDGDANTIGNVITTFSGNTLTFDPAMLLNQQYFLTAMVGNDMGGGVIDESDGCLSTAQGIPVIFRSLPTAQIIPLGSLMLDCDHTSVQLDGTSSQGSSGLNYAWQGPTAISNPNDPLVAVSDSGAYVLVVTDAFGCMNNTEVAVALADGLPELILNGVENITCDNDAIVIEANGSSQGSEYEWNWVGNGIAGSDASQVTISEPGSYALQIENTTTDCMVEELFTIGVDTLAPAYTVSNQNYIDCQTDQATINLSLTSCLDCDVTWTTDAGSFVDLSDPMSPVVSGQGNFQFFITDNETGCENNGEIAVLPNPNGPQDLFYDLMQPDCLENPDGMIVVNEVIGGVAPYNFSVNGLPATTDNTIDNLSPGLYALQVTDSQGCSQTMEVTIIQPDEVSVDLGDDITISLGEEVTLYPEADEPIQSYTWTTEFTMDCDSCKNPSLWPTGQTLVHLLVMTADGCIAEDRVNIFVIEKVPFYIPNAFSPNGDGNNDLFKPFFDEKGVEQILSFQIYNRWGELIFEELPNDLQSLQGWNGKSTEKDLNPGVFIYKIHVLFKNGKDEILGGDVTLIR